MNDRPIVITVRILTDNWLQRASRLKTVKCALRVGANLRSINVDDLRRATTILAMATPAPKHGVVVGDTDGPLSTRGLAGVSKSISRDYRCRGL